MYVSLPIFINFLQQWRSKLEILFQFVLLEASWPRQSKGELLNLLEQHSALKFSSELETFLIVQAVELFHTGKLNMNIFSSVYNCALANLKEIFVSSPRSGEILFQSKTASTLTIFFSCLSSNSLMLNIILTPPVFVSSFMVLTDR